VVWAVFPEVIDMPLTIITGLQDENAHQEFLLQNDVIKQKFSNFMSSYVAAAAVRTQVSAQINPGS
jgi:hypothetical protein